MQPEVALHEPKHALDGGADGLDAIRRLVAQVRDRVALRPHGALYLEIGVGQAEAVQRILAQAGFEGVQTRADWAGIPRIARGFFAGAQRTA